MTEYCLVVNLSNPKLTLGIEEELFLVEANTKEIATTIPPPLQKAFEEAYPKQIVPEFLRGQIEIITQPSDHFPSLLQELEALRICVANLAAPYGLFPIAASTHPFTYWQSQTPNLKPRYKRLNDSLKIAARRMLVGGMHCHIGMENIANSKWRIPFLNHMAWYLPYFLILSTSSAFWQGMDTGMNSFRLNIIDGLPRSGLPPHFECLQDYNHYIATLKKAKIIEDPCDVWWDLRISCRFPTIEMRITDVCTSIPDCSAVTALFACLAKWFTRMPKDIAQFITDPRSQLLLRENRWRAQRFSLAQGSLFNDRGVLTPNHALFDDLIDRLEIEAKSLDCTHALQHIKTILSRGTSADLQRKVYHDAIENKASNDDSLKKVVAFLIEETVNTSHTKQIIYPKKNASGQG